MAKPSYQALPKFIVPKHKGLTLTDDVGDNSLYRARGLCGGGAMGIAVSTAIPWEVLGMLDEASPLLVKVKGLDMVRNRHSQHLSRVLDNPDEDYLSKTPKSY